MEHKLLDDFIVFMKINRSSSKNTINAYIRDIREFFEILNLEISLENCKKINNENLRKYLLTKRERCKNRSISRKIVSIKMFFKFINEMYEIQNDFVLNMSGLKFCSTLPKAVENQTILDICEKLNEIIKYKNNFELVRDKFLILLLYSTGLRISEALNLSIFELKQDKITIKGKGEKDREVLIIPIIHDMLHKYINEAEKNGVILKEKAFIKNNGKSMSARDVERLFEKIQIATGLEKFSPHTMRHSFATSMLSGGANIKQIQEILGHSNLETTQKYVKITPKLLSDKLTKIKW